MSFCSHHLFSCAFVPETQEYRLPTHNPQHINFEFAGEGIQYTFSVTISPTRPSSYPTVKSPLVPDTADEFKKHFYQQYLNPTQLSDDDRIALSAYECYVPKVPFEFLDQYHQQQLSRGAQLCIDFKGYIEQQKREFLTSLKSGQLNIEMTFVDPVQNFSLIQLKYVSVFGSAARDSDDDIKNDRGFCSPLSLGGTPRVGETPVRLARSLSLLENALQTQEPGDESGLSDELFGPRDSNGRSNAEGLAPMDEAVSSVISLEGSYPEIVEPALDQKISIDQFETLDDFLEYLFKCLQIAIQTA